MRALAFMGTAFSLLPGMSRTNPYLTIDDRYNITTAPTQSSLYSLRLPNYPTAAAQIEKQTSKHDNQKVVIQTLTRLGKGMFLSYCDQSFTNGFKMSNDLGFKLANI